MHFAHFTSSHQTQTDTATDAISPTHQTFAHQLIHRTEARRRSGYDSSWEHKNENEIIDKTKSDWKYNTRQDKTRQDNIIQDKTS